MVVSSSGKPEVVSAENGLTSNCSDLSEFPINVDAGSTGGVFDDGTIVVCGGYGGYCTFFNNGLVTHRNIALRRNAASVVFNPGKLFITGGSGP